mgnify:CR=1 FL=1
MYVYVAGPYTNGDSVLNVRAVCAAAERIIAAGHVPFVPHLYHLWHLIAPKEYQYWLDLDRAWLRKCEVMVRLPGHSPGADKEAEWAKEEGIAVISLEDFLRRAGGGG